MSNSSGLWSLGRLSPKLVDVSISSGKELKSDDLLLNGLLLSVILGLSELALKSEDLSSLLSASGSSHSSDDSVVDSSLNNSSSSNDRWLFLDSGDVSDSSVPLVDVSSVGSLLGWSCLDLSLVVDNSVVSSLDVSSHEFSSTLDDLVSGNSSPDDSSLALWSSLGLSLEGSDSSSVDSDNSSVVDSSDDSSSDNLSGLSNDSSNRWLSRDSSDGGDSSSEVLDSLGVDWLLGWSGLDEFSVVDDSSVDLGSVSSNEVSSTSDDSVSEDSSSDNGSLWLWNSLSLSSEDTDSSSVLSDNASSDNSLRNSLLSSLSVLSSEDYSVLGASSSNADLSVEILSYLLNLWLLEVLTDDLVDGLRIGELLGVKLGWLSLVLKLKIGNSDLKFVDVSSTIGNSVLLVELSSLLRSSLSSWSSNVSLL